ncbi:hypothetical protein ACP0HM_05350 [Escherichia coli]
MVLYATGFEKNIENMAKMLSFDKKSIPVPDKKRHFSTTTTNINQR